MARELEPRLASDIPVFSAASAFRYDDGRAAAHPAGQRRPRAADRASSSKPRGFKGFIVPIPNCTTTGLAVTLAPLAERFGVKAVLMTSLQAMSGAGRSPGVIGLDILDNVVPYIPKEEHKVEVETKKILGALQARARRSPRTT